MINPFAAPGTAFVEPLPFILFPSQTQAKKNLLRTRMQRENQLSYMPMQ
jgi:hypothetical protein